MALHHAVLALLARGPSHGYELRAAFDDAVGPQWGPLNIGHVYQLIDRLTRDGLVTSERHPQDSRPDRVVHQLTPAGRAELDRWLAEPTTRSRGYRDDFFLKLLAATTTPQPAGTADAVIARQRRHLMQELRDLQTDPTPLDGISALVRTAAELHLTADLNLLDHAEQHLTRQRPGAPAATGGTAESRVDRTQRSA